MYFLHQYILNHGNLVVFSVAIFLNSRWRPDTLSIVVGTKFHMKLYISQSIFVPIFVLLPYIYSEICRIIDIENGHFKIQDGGQVSCQYQFHTNPYIIKCMCANFSSPVVNIF